MGLRDGYLRHRRDLHHRPCARGEGCIVDTGGRRRPDDWLLHRGVRDGGLDRPVSLPMGPPHALRLRVLHDLPAASDYLRGGLQHAGVHLPSNSASTSTSTSPLSLTTLSPSPTFFSLSTHRSGHSSQTSARPSSSPLSAPSPRHLSSAALYGMRARSACATLSACSPP